MKKRRSVAVVLTLLVLLAAVLSSAAPTRAENPVQRPYTDDVFYLIMTDRFANGDPSNDIGAQPNSSTGIHGGDLQGIIDKLDYLRDLGVTGIWMTPVVDNQVGSYHGYWTTDYYKVDANLGSMETLQRLVAEAHKRGIKIFLDVVVNHTAPTHPWVNDPTKKEWYHRAIDIINWDDQQQVENGRLLGLPDLAQENPAVKQYLIEMSKWWIQQTNVDGLRLDTVRHVPKWFWEEYTKEIHTARPEIFLLGEVYVQDLRYIRGYLHTGLDGAVDFARYYPMLEVFAQGKDPSVLHATVLRQITETPEKIWAPFIDNHDVPRFNTTAAPGGYTKTRLALAYLLTSPGMPIIYYGTEVGLEGGGDPDNRRDMRFGSNAEQFAYTQTLIKLRRANPAFTRGSYAPINTNPRVVAFMREYQGQRFVVALNNSGSAERLDLTQVVGQNERITNLLGAYQPTAEGMVLKLDAWTPYVLAVGDVNQSDVMTGPGLLLGMIVGAIVAVGTGVFLLFKRKEQR